MKAKTYYSTNNWSAPQSLSTFGIPIQKNKSIKYLGLEEFNFCEKVTNIKFEHKFLAYIPCFSQRIIPHIDTLDLFYSSGNNTTIHYATLKGVSQILEDDQILENDKDSQINSIRQILKNEKFLNWVKTNQDFQNNYEILFEAAYKIYKLNFDTNKILAKAHENRFIFNVLYDKVIFHTPEKSVDWSNLKRARHLFL